MLFTVPSIPATLPELGWQVDRAPATAFTFHANRYVDGTLNPGCRAFRGNLCNLFSVGDKTWRQLPKDVCFSFLCLVLDMHAFTLYFKIHFKTICVFSSYFSAKVYLLAQFRACHLYRPSHIGLMYVTIGKRKISVTYRVLVVRRLIGLVCMRLHCWSGCRK